MQSDMTEVEELNYFKDKHQTAPFSCLVELVHRQTE